MPEPVLAAYPWKTNGHLIEACHRLNYLKDEDRVLDPTAGKMGWWTQWRPEHLDARDQKTHPSWDFRNMLECPCPVKDESFDAVAYDPPYISVGGRETTGIPEMHSRYGMDNAGKTPCLVQETINAGLSECYRVTKPGGIILTKCQDYISSGKLFLGTFLTLDHALSLGLECIDRLEHITHPRPQPPGRRQLHARRNLSTLLVFRKGKPIVGYRQKMGSYV